MQPVMGRMLGLRLEWTTSWGLALGISRPTTAPITPSMWSSAPPIAKWWQLAFGRPQAMGALPSPPSTLAPTGRTPSSQSGLCKCGQLTAPGGQWGQVRCKLQVGCLLMAVNAAVVNASAVVGARGIGRPWLQLQGPLTCPPTGATQLSFMQCVTTAATTLATFATSTRPLLTLPME